MFFRNCLESVSLDILGSRAATGAGSSGESPGNSIPLCRGTKDRRGECEVRPCRINTACGMDQFIKHNNEKTPVLEFNLTTRAGTKKTEVGSVVLLQAAVCQESGPTCTLWAQTNTDRRMSCGLVI